MKTREISVRICIKKNPRHTGLAVPPECKNWRKFSVMLPTIDENWVPLEKDVGAYDQVWKELAQIQLNSNPND